jgi:hAT family C-terminal dimerisation region
LKGWHWKDDNKASKSKNFLIQEVLALASSEERVHVDLASSSDDCNSDASFDVLFDDRNVRRSSIDSQYKELSSIKTLKVDFEHEVTTYLNHTERMSIKDSRHLQLFQWWRDIVRKKFPNMALAARKWLSVTATSTPSERVFSICGILNTARRSSFVGNSIEDQGFLHNSLK